MIALKQIEAVSWINKGYFSINYKVFLSTVKLFTSVKILNQTLFYLKFYQCLVHSTNSDQWHCHICFKY